MKWRIFEIGGFVSAKEKVQKVLKLTTILENSDFAGSSSIYTSQGLRQSNTFNPQAYMVANQRMHEIETQKAMATIVSRHQSGKAGGPH